MSTLLAVSGWAAFAIAEVRPTGSGTAGSGRSDQAREFAPGVRIDWQQRVVEVDAKVVLREGALELLACSPQTREHESVFVVPARPMHIFQAMGLIGLANGRPVHYDNEQQRRVVPTGQALQIWVRCRHEGAQRRVPVERFVADIETGRPPESLNWVFAGSRRLRDGRLAAELDGTIICVVDFDSALIALSSLHSADNELLWLAANTKEIPPVGTPCTLLIRSAAGETVEIVVAVAADGTLRHDNAEISVADLVKRLQPGKADSQKVTVALRPGSDVEARILKTVIEALVGAGIDHRSIEVRKRGIHSDE